MASQLSTKTRLKTLALRTLPLGARKALAIAVNKQPFFARATRGYYAAELLSDFAEDDINAYHKFLWKHHLSYAETYEIDQRFGYDRFNETRRMFLGELPNRARSAGLEIGDFRSVLDVGCSLGYFLRYIETDLLPSATHLCGIDIDDNAIAQGRKHLAELNSSVELKLGDMESIDAEYGEASFDLVVALGVLLYLNQSSAADLVAKMLRCSRKMLAITALACLEHDNRELKASVPRPSDNTWIHNVDAMIEQAGGRIVGRRWESRMVDGNTLYFLFAVPSVSGRVAR